MIAVCALAVYISRILFINVFKHVCYVLYFMYVLYIHNYSDFIFNYDRLFQEDVEDTECNF